MKLTYDKGTCVREILGATTPAEAFRLLDAYARADDWEVVFRASYALRSYGRKGIIPYVIVAGFHLGGTEADYAWKALADTWLAYGHPVFRDACYWFARFELPNRPKLQPNELAPALAKTAQIMTGSDSSNPCETSIYFEIQRAISNGDLKQGLDTFEKAQTIYPASRSVRWAGHQLYQAIPFKYEQSCLIYHHGTVKSYGIRGDSTFGYLVKEFTGRGFARNHMNLATETDFSEIHFVRNPLGKLFQTDFKNLFSKIKKEAA